MLFSLNYVNHLIENFNEVPVVFFERCINNNQFGDVLFPQWFLPVVNTSPVLKKKFRDVFNLVNAMTQQEKQALYDRLVADLDIEILCHNNILTPIYTLNDYPNLHNTLSSLFNHLYSETLQTSISLNNALNTSLADYHRVWKTNNPFIVCPFCGLENYSSSIGTNRDPYDHLLCKSKYPLSAINFRNLIPIGDKCNQTAVKGEIDVLHNDDFVRRIAFYPYGQGTTVQLRIICLTPPSAGYRGEWDIEISCPDHNDLQKLSTWMEVFNIKERYLSWIKDFMDGWKDSFLKYLAKTGTIVTPTANDIRIILATWKNSLPSMEIFSGVILLDAYIDHLINDANESTLLAFCNVQLNPDEAA
jgi:hypothetical protein